VNTKTLLTILKYVASIGILAWLIASRREEFTAFLNQEKNLWWLAVAACLMTLAFTFSYLRWQHLAKAIRLEISTKEALKLGFLGSFFNVIAFGVVGGDSLRAWYVARSKKDRLPEAILSVFIDRAIGLMVMFGFAGIAWQINKSTNAVSVSDDKQAAIAGICNTAGVFSIIGAIILLTLLFFPGIRKAAPFQLLTRIPKIGGLIGRGMEAAALYSQNRFTIVIAILFSIGTNVLFATTIWLVALGTTPSPPAFVEHLAMAPIAMLANSVPLPGGVGGMEFALTYMYESKQASGGVIVAICYRLCIMFVAMIGWIVWLAGGREKMPETPAE